MADDKLSPWESFTRKKDSNEENGLKYNKGIGRFRNRGIGLIVVWVIVIAIFFFIVPLIWSMWVGGFIDVTSNPLATGMSLAVTIAVLIAGGGWDMAIKQL